MRWEVGWAVGLGFEKTFKITTGSRTKGRPRAA